MESPAPEKNEFGERLAAMRLLHGLSLEDVAGRSGLTKSFLSKLERGLSQPSIATVLKLAEAFGVPSARLVGESPEPEPIALVRKDDRIPFSRTEGRAGYAYEAIAARRAAGSMTSFVMRPPLARSAKVDLVTHAGEELVFVLSGAMELVFPDRSFTLHAGDSVCFPASTPHRSRSLGKSAAEALVVVSVPTVAGEEPAPARRRARR